MKHGSETRPSGSTGKRYWSFYVGFSVLILCIGIYVQKFRNGYSMRTTQEEERTATGQAAGERGCVPPSIHHFPEDLFSQEQRQKGFVLMHFGVTAYLCLILAIVCDQYFVPSLEHISNYFQVPVDVAGATFMAIGTSSPELYSAVIGSFVTEGDIGIGTIVGSAVFNILGVTSVTGLLLWKTEAPVDWYPVSRDCLVYVLSVAMLIFIIQDNVVTWFESSVLIAMFLLYIALMFFNHSIQESCKEKIEDLSTWWKQYRKARSRSLRMHSRQSRSVSTKRTPKPLEGDSTVKNNQETGMSNYKEEDSDSDDEDMSPWSVPTDSSGQFLLWLVTWPALVLVTCTIPSCKKPNERFFVLTFLSSVLWIGVLSYLCSWMVTVIGHTFGLPDSVAGITILAAGISVPEVIASVIVVKSGMANMAFSNLIGSNIFDILFCLGLPWLLKTLLFSQNRELTVNSSALAYSATTLLGTVVLLFLTLSLAGWKLNLRVGLACLGLYISFLIIACMFEMNYFADMNPPTCDV